MEITKTQQETLNEIEGSEIFWQDYGVVLIQNNQLIRNGTVLLTITEEKEAAEVINAYIKIEGINYEIVKGV